MLTFVRRESVTEYPDGMVGYLYISSLINVSVVSESTQIHVFCHVLQRTAPDQYAGLAPDMGNGSNGLGGR